MKPRSKPIGTPETPGTKRSRATFTEPSSRPAKEKGALPPTAAAESQTESVRISAKKPRPASTISADEIARRAHELWLREGQPHGRHLDHWYRAEEELRKERQG